MLWHFFATGDTFSQEKAVAGPEKGAACYETMLGEAVPLAPSHPAFSPIELDPFDYLLVRFIQLIRLPPFSLSAQAPFCPWQLLARLMH